MVDVVAGGISTTASLAVSGSVTGTIDSFALIPGLTDQDWYRVSLTAGTTYQFTLSSPVLDGVLRLYDSTGVSLRYVDNGWAPGITETLTYTASSSGTFYVAAAGWTTSTGVYTLSASVGASIVGLPAVVPPASGTDNEPTASVATVATLTAGSSISGAIEQSYDHDWFRIDLVSGNSYQFDLASAAGSTLDSYLRLRDSSGILLASNDDGGVNLNSLINYTATQTGTYYLDAGGFSSSTGSYTLSATVGVPAVVPPTFGVDDEPTAAATTAAAVAVGASINGSIEQSYDHDWFRIDLVSGNSYQFDQVRATGSTLDSYLRLRDSNGVMLASNDDSGWSLNSHINYTATQTGTYYLDAGGFSSSTGSYTLSATVASTVGVPAVAPPAPGADDEPTAAATTAATVTVGASINGAIEQFYDHDWFRIDLVSGNSYQFDQVRAAGSTLDSYLRLRDSNGVMLASNDDSEWSLNSHINYTATQTGTYYLDAGGFSSSTGSYTLSATVGAATVGVPAVVPPTLGVDDEPTAAATTAATVAVGASINGAIEQSYDHDWFRVDLVSGNSYQFDQVRAPGSTLDSYLSLRDSNGIMLVSNDDGGGNLNSHINYTAMQTGTYYLDASGFSSSTGNYTLNVTVGAPAVAVPPVVTPVVDDEPTAAATTVATLVAGATINGTIEQSLDHDWFRIDLVSGNSYQFDQVRAAGSTLDSYLRLRDSNGIMLASNDDSGGSLNSHINYTATQTGTYYLDAGGFGFSTGSYTLSASDIASLVLSGTVGNDLLTGGSGNDTLTGGAGKDVLTGGLGADRFYFGSVSDTGIDSATWDVITDFKSSELDKIDLSFIDADVVTAGNQAFGFIGTAAFDGVNASGQLRFDSTARVLYGSTDADNAAEFAIALNGVTSLTASDFVL